MQQEQQHTYGHPRINSRRSHLCAANWKNDQSPLMWGRERGRDKHLESEMLPPTDLEAMSNNYK